MRRTTTRPGCSGHPGHDVFPEAERWLRFGASWSLPCCWPESVVLRDGRTMVQAEDLVPAALPVLRHRLHQFEAEAEVDTDLAVKAVPETVPQHSVST